MASFLTKSNFMSGLQCHKQLWLAVNEPHRATSLNLAQQRVIDQGDAVGQFARQQFPNGQLVQGNGSEAIQATQAAIAVGATCLDVLTKSKRPEVQKLAKDIITCQQAEIDPMKQWRKAWYKQ